MKSIVAFLKHLLLTVAGNITLIWDGAKIRHCQEVKALLQSPDGKRLRLTRLPTYSPDLNPNEGVWRWLNAS